MGGPKKGTEVEMSKRRYSYKKERICDGNASHNNTQRIVRVRQLRKKPGLPKREKSCTLKNGSRNKTAMGKSCSNRTLKEVPPGRQGSRCAAKSRTPDSLSRVPGEQKVTGKVEDLG